MTGAGDRIDCLKAAWVPPDKFEVEVAENGKPAPHDLVRLIPSVPLDRVPESYDEDPDEVDRASVRHFRALMKRCEPVDPGVLTVWDPPLSPAGPVFYDGSHRAQAAVRLGIERVPLAVVFADEYTETPHEPPPDWERRTLSLLADLHRWEEHPEDRPPGTGEMSPPRLERMKQNIDRMNKLVEENRERAKRGLPPIPFRYRPDRRKT